MNFHCNQQTGEYIAFCGILADFSHLTSKAPKLNLVNLQKKTEQTEKSAKTQPSALFLLNFSS